MSIKECFEWADKSATIDTYQYTMSLVGKCWAQERGFPAFDLARALVKDPLRRLAIPWLVGSMPM